jgi:hypothetical protein
VKKADHWRAIFLSRMFNIIFFAASHNDVVFASSDIARSQIETFFTILSENEIEIFGYFIWRGLFTYCF